MAFAPTPSQQEAIDTVDCHLAVTAGAGSGKTRVLVERYLNLLDQGTPIHEIAAITFTKKAAQEMRDRLRLARPDLTEDLERAQISTIHSLCQRIIQEHPLQAAIDPRFRIGEEWETQALLLQIIEEVVEESELPEELGDQARTVDLVWDLYQEMLTKGERDFTPQDTSVENNGPDLLVAPLYQEVEQLLLLPPTTAVQKEAMEGLQAEWPAIKGLLSFPDPDLQLEALDVLNGFIKKIRGKLAEHTVLIKELIAEGQEAIHTQRGKEIIAWLNQVLAAVHYSYNQAKRDLGILDYNDLEHLAYKLLQDPEVRAHYDFTHLMVDEFQDTNPIQKEIVDSFVLQGALLFVVGDPKQSIYRFRGADVGVFVQTKEEIDQTGKNVVLADNFRSRPELIEFANHFFPQVMQDGPTAFEASKVSRKKAERPCVTLLRTPAEGLNLDEGRVKEAEQIAIQIRQLVDSGQYKYEDVALLFRAMTNVRIYERGLQAANIPYVNLSGRGFYAQQEIRDVLHYFSWLEDPENHVARLAVLRSPFYLISDEGLYWLQGGQPEKLTEEEQKSLAQAEEDYSYLAHLVKYEGAPRVITAMLERTNYIQTTWQLPFGPQKVANIEKLLEQSWKLYAQDLVSVPEQLRYIQLMSRDSKGEGEALLDAEHADVVKLLTIHGSKGLEFPVVFLPDTSGSLTRSQGGPVLYHPEFGLTYRGTKNYESLKETEKIAEHYESQRLLYVAVTRAEEELYWCGLDDGKNRESWWKWLQNALPEIPNHLYREIVGDLPSLEVEHSQGEPSKLKLTHYKPLAPQYNQVVFSVTSLMSYNHCPRYYYLRYLLRVPELKLSSAQINGEGGRSGLSALQRGNIVHRVVEQIRSPHELGQLLDYAAQMEGVELDLGQKIQLERTIYPYLQSDFFGRVANDQAEWEVHHELEFNVPAGDFLVNGLVDQVFVSSTELEVVDFKSNWIRPEQVQEVGQSYGVQLRLYAWAMAREFGLPVSKSQAYFLIPNMVYQLDEKLLDPAETERWVTEICHEIVRGAEVGEEAFLPKGDCTNCVQSSYCGNYPSIGENTDDHLAWVEGE